MMIYGLLVCMVFVSAIFSRLFGALRGAFVASLLLVAGGMATYKFGDAGAVVLVLGAFTLPLLLGAIALGTAAGAAIKSKHRYVAAALLAIPVLLLSRQLIVDFVNRENEQAAVQFVSRLPQLSADLARGALIYPVSRRYGDGPRPTHYEYVVGKRYILIDAADDFWTARFSLACITDIPPGKRQPFVDICKQ